MSATKPSVSEVFVFRSRNPADKSAGKLPGKGQEAGIGEGSLSNGRHGQERHEKESNNQAGRGYVGIVTTSVLDRCVCWE